MSILTLILIAIIIGAIILVFNRYKGKPQNPHKFKRINNYIKSISLFALVFGIFGQLIGLFSIFSAVKLASVEVSSSMILKGFKVSMITSIYGAIIFVVGYVFYRVFQKYIRSAKA